MDIATHIIFGATLQPTIATVVGTVIPDLSMIIRKDNPDIYYKVSHSLIFPLAIFFINKDVSIGILSHILLDFFTHGKIFAPMLLYPFSKWKCGIFKEWEFFTKEYLIILIIVLCLFLFRIGFL